MSVAYPFAPVTPDPPGGAEQVLAQIDRALIAAGHRSIVVACEGSATAGALRPVAANDAGDEMVTEHVIFSATGVTDGSIVRGARRDGEWMETETLLMRSKTGSMRRLLYRQRNQ